MLNMLSTGTLCLCGPNSDYLCYEKYVLPHTAKASLAEPSWLEMSRHFGRHHLGAFPQINYQKSASLLRKGAEDHIHTLS